MTQEQFLNLRCMIQSGDVETLLLGYSLIITCNKYEYLKSTYENQKYDNTKCKYAGQTIGQLCLFLEKKQKDSEIVKTAWPKLKDTLYIPAGLAFLDAMKDELVDSIEENN